MKYKNIQITRWRLGAQGLNFSRRANAVIFSGSQSYLNVFPPNSFPQFMARAKGPYIWDIDGNRYIDLYLGSGAIILGHGYEEQIKAVRQQLRYGASVSFRHPIEVEIAEWMKERMPFAERTMFFKTGSEATHAALQIALEHASRPFAISLGYHGWLPPFRNGWPKSNTIQVIEGSWELVPLLEIIRENETKLGAVIVSPDPCMLSPDFYKALESEVRRVGAVFIMDEIKSGFRYKFPCLSVAYGLNPDICLFSKAFSNGFPIAVLTGKDVLLTDSGSFEIFSTFACETLSLVAAKASLKLLEKGAYARFERAACFLYSELSRHLSSDSVRLIGEPTFFRLHFKEPRLSQEFAMQLVNAGILYHPLDEILLSSSHDPKIVLTRVLEAMKRVAKELEIL